MSGKTARAARKVAAVKAPKRREDPARERRKRLALWSAVAVGAAIAGLYAITAGGGGSRGASDAMSASGYGFAVGSPGPGEPAPPVNLVASTGDSFSLAAYRGKEQVLLYFQEGLMCQPCWDQIVAIEQELPKFKALGIGPIVSITGDPLELIAQKVSDEGIRSPVMSDPDFSVSDSYDARTYGMMGGQMAGHSFILVGKDGKIRWRADYGGPPDFTMFVPVDALLEDLRAGLEQPA